MSKFDVFKKRKKNAASQKYTTIEQLFGPILQKIDNILIQTKFGVVSIKNVYIFSQVLALLTPVYVFTQIIYIQIGITS